MKFSTSEWLVLNRPQVAGFHSPGDIKADWDDQFYLRLAADNGTKVYLNHAKPGDVLLHSSEVNRGDFRPFATWTQWVKVDD